MLASLLAWTLGFAALAVGVKGFGPRGAPWVFGVVFPAVLLPLVLSLAPGARSLVLPTTALANATAGIVAVWPIFTGILRQPEAAASAAIICTYFCFTIFRLRPGMAASAAMSYLAVNQGLLLTDHVSTVARVVASVLPLVAFATGLLVAVVLDRMAHDAFRQEQIIELQASVIATEQQRTESLLLNILPRAIADRLKVSTGAIADYYPEATILFADLVGFTPLAASLPPTDVVAMLNEVFSAFDQLAARYGAEKIKTIGDAYMAVTGLPEPRHDHAALAADLALAMREKIATFGERFGVPVSFRIGLCSGPAVAGVIGTHKFAYDLWGDAVNTAARMEAHGLPGEIQVAEQTFLHLRDRYVLADRGVVDIKGKGPTRTWLLQERLGDAAVPVAPAAKLEA